MKQREVGDRSWMDTFDGRSGRRAGGVNSYYLDLCLHFSLVLSFLNALVDNTGSRSGSSPTLYLCLQPDVVWSLCIPSCHGRARLMFRECSGGWCLPLRVSTWHFPPGKHVHNWVDGAVGPAGCLSHRAGISPAERADVSQSDWAVLKGISVIISEPDTTYMTGGSIAITQRVKCKILLHSQVESLPSCLYVWREHLAKLRHMPLNPHFYCKPLITRVVVNEMFQQ